MAFCLPNKADSEDSSTWEIVRVPVSPVSKTEAFTRLKFNIIEEALLADWVCCHTRFCLVQTEKRHQNTNHYHNMFHCRPHDREAVLVMYLSGVLA